MIYGLEETTEAPSCLAQKPAGSCQAQLEREGRGKVIPLSPEGVFLHPWERWVGNWAGDGAELVRVAHAILCHLHLYNTWSDATKRHRATGPSAAQGPPSVCCQKTLCCPSGAGCNLIPSVCLTHLAAISSSYYIRVLEIGRKLLGITLIATK